MMTDHLNEVDEHERSERTGCRVTARKMPRSIERPSGQTEWSHKRDRVVIQSLVVGPGWQVERPTPPGETPTGIKPEWAVFFVVPYLPGTSRYWSPVVAARWLLGRWLWRWLQANWAWAADVILRLRIPLSFSWTRFGCVFSRIFLTGGCLPEFFGVGDLFRTGALFATFAAGPWTSPRTPHFLAFDAYTEFFLVASALISSSRQLMDCLNLAGPGSGPPDFGIFRPSETNFYSLLRVRCRVGSLLSSLLLYRDAHEYLNQE